MIPILEKNCGSSDNNCGGNLDCGNCSNTGNQRKEKTCNITNGNCEKLNI